MIQALIFDCDGTLVDSMFAHYSAWREALVSQGIKLDEQACSGVRTQNRQFDL